MRFGFLGVLVAAMLFAGCAGDKDPQPTLGSSAGPVAVPSPETPTQPADAVEVAKEIGFPLIPKPLKNALATRQDKGSGEIRFEIDQIVRETPKQAADFYAKKLGIEPNQESGAFDLKGETADHSFVLMVIKSVDGKTAVGATILKMSAPSK